MEMIRKLIKKPGGLKILSKGFRFFVPYSGSIRPEVVSLSAGKCTIRIKDRRRVRNHLNCIHAVALTNLGELTSGLAMSVAMPNSSRGIVTKLETEYLKKARGAITATCSDPLPDFTKECEHVATAELRDASNEVVAIFRAHWKIGPRQ
jgi:acyl-coenzyme A thioesterase PaaI-like protein